MITAVIPETPDAVSLQLQPLDGWQPQYKAGQFITFVFYTTSGEKRRSYSISSTPSMGEPLQITIKRQANGEFSRPLVAQSQVGNILHSTGIGGFFTLPTRISHIKTICFLAAGSGIAPCMALIKFILVNESQKIVLFYSNSHQQQTIFYDSLNQLALAYPNRITIKYLFSSNKDIMEGRLSHWLLSQLLVQYQIPVRQSLFFICGPFDYMQMAGISLLSNGAIKKQIITEDFFPLPKTTIPRPPDTDAHRVRILIDQKQFELLVQYPQSITATARAHGITLPYSCESGRCGSCAATCLSGKIWMAYNEILTDEEIAAGRVLTCQGFAIGGDAVIEYP